MHIWRDGTQGVSGDKNRGIKPKAAIFVSSRQSDERQSVYVSPHAQGAHWGEDSGRFVTPGKTYQVNSSLRADCWCHVPVRVVAATVFATSF